jgi:predicted DNA-binding protein (MmcQ/YjbR family)
MAVNKQEYLQWCCELENTIVDQPFEADFSSWIVRHADTRKWFAAVLEHDGREFVNLKCDPIEGEFLRSVYEGVTCGYHMNKTHWISVHFESDVPDELLRQLTLASRRLTEKRKKSLRKSAAVIPPEVRK